jgi:hypothetical protein
MEIIAFASFLVLIVSWIVLPVRAPLVSVEKQKAA